MAPGTAAAVYVVEVSPQIIVLPEIKDGARGAVVTVIVRAKLVPQPFDSVNEITPVVNVPLKETTIVLVPKPLVIVAPEGTVQL